MRLWRCEILGQLQADLQGGWLKGLKGEFGDDAVDIRLGQPHNQRTITFRVTLPVQSSEGCIASRDGSAWDELIHFPPLHQVKLRF
jgi:hypothetical protein